MNEKMQWKHDGTYDLYSDNFFICSNAMDAHGCVTMYFLNSLFQTPNLLQIGFLAIVLFL